MIDTPILLDTPEQATAVIDLTVSRADISQVFRPAIAEILTTLAAQGISPIGACFSYYFKKQTDAFDF